LKNKAGMVSCLVSPHDDIHEMNNVTDRDTVEIHVYRGPQGSGLYFCCWSRSSEYSADCRIM
jgi:hypothetical protein